MKKVFLLAFFMIPLQSLVHAQCPEYSTQIPQLHGLVVGLSASQDPSTKIYTYRYSMRHDSISIGCIREFELDISYPANRDSLSSSGLTDYPRYITRNFGPVSNIKSIPVGIPSLPTYKGIPSSWGVIVTTDGKISWGSDFLLVELEPGGQLGNLLLTSYGLPGIRTFTVRPKYNPTPVSEGEVTDESFAVLRTITDSIGRRGSTIG